jgi:hypothetical protein
MLVALGHETWTPSDEQRARVRTLAYNRVPHERIARFLHCTVEELRFHFQHELELGEDEILALAAANIFRLANQQEDLGVALRANQMLLQTRHAGWREPKPTAEDSAQKRISQMTTEELEALVEAATAEHH